MDRQKNIVDIHNILALVMDLRDGKTSRSKPQRSGVKRGVKAVYIWNSTIFRARNPNVTECFVDKNTRIYLSTTSLLFVGNEKFPKRTINKYLLSEVKQLKMAFLQNIV